MAVIAPVLTGRVPVEQNFPNETLEATWTMTTGDTATPIALGAYSDRSVEIDVTAGTPTITIAGSNGGTNFATLNDHQGTALSFTADGLKGISEATKYIKPVLAGTGSATIYIFGRG